MTQYSLPTQTLPLHCPCQPRSRLPFPTRIHRVSQSPPRTAHHPKRQMSLSIISPITKTTTLPPQVKKGGESKVDLLH
ncbi:hypothetical protein KC316_g15 [Hortaea werneckii]|nr:hypothetical protein KC316_g15 [Hortaea werneckii]